MRPAGKLVLAGVVFAMCASAFAQAPDWAARGKSWWTHVQFLADDKLEGRGTGTPGFEKAAAYVEQQFREAGLQPAGRNGYAQPVEFNVVQLDEAHSRLELVSGGKGEPVKLGEDAFLVASASTFGKVDAGAVFVGYGLQIPELQYDDLGGQNLKGKIIVYVTGGPASIPAEVKAHYQSNEERAKAYAAAGAVGAMQIPNPTAEEVPWARTAGARFSQKMELKEKAKGVVGWPKAKAMVNPAHADKIFAGSGHSWQEILDAIEAKKPLPHFPLAVTVRAETGLKRSSAKSENIAGVLAGSDPKLKDEYVVVSAHLDHLGIGAAVNGDKIYNGAMDDASGVASVIEIAKAMKQSGAKPKRSILFLAVTAEEKGELGSEYFAAHPTVKGTIVADINMDMYLPLFPLKYLEVQGLNESSLGDDIRAVCKEAGVEVQADKEPEHVRFIRSDQYSFIKTGVPALAFKFGWVPGSPEQKIFRDWYKERYHGPADDVSQPVDKEAAAQFNAILEGLALRVADAEARPEWKRESFFRRFQR